MQIRAWLPEPTTGETFVSYYDVLTSGAGYLDLTEALETHDVVAGSALSPSVAFNSSSRQIYLQFSSSSTWSLSGSWGLNAPLNVWGNAGLTSNAVIRTPSPVLTNTHASGNSEVWGNSAVWGNSPFGATLQSGETAASGPPPRTLGSRASSEPL